MQFKLIALLTLTIATVNGATLLKRSGTCTCASDSYSSTATGDAIAQAESGTFRGYPHQYHDFEGFTFICGGSTYYEFPILEDGELFDGSTSPGPDRVVFDDGGAFCGCITHTGVSGNAFLQCS